MENKDKKQGLLRYGKFGQFLGCSFRGRIPKGVLSSSQTIFEGRIFWR
jgi:hypothetical protein